MYGRKALHNQIEEDKNMKKRTRKLLTMVCCAVALVVISVGATLAYLTDTESVTNTFTVGEVKITLDEAKTNTDGEPMKGETVVENLADADRVNANSYRLLPGESYTKDPTVHVDAVSEDSWIFVKIQNDITAIEIKTETDTEKKIATQILANGWTALDDVAGVYYQSYSKTQDDKNLEVFGNFTIDSSVDNTTLATYANKQVVITAYAIQKAGLDTAAKAWTAGAWAN